MADKVAQNVDDALKGIAMAFEILRDSPRQEKLMRWFKDAMKGDIPKEALLEFMLFEPIKMGVGKSQGIGPLLMLSKVGRELGIDKDLPIDREGPLSLLESYMSLIISQITVYQLLSEDSGYFSEVRLRNTVRRLFEEGKLPLRG